ncbi:MAG: hypothetical protein H7098_03560 [Oligoflexus sp.]|nr:hypothetical protein [Pseudopedobacter sp.]
MSKQITEEDKFLIFHSNPTEISKNQLSEINSLIGKYPYCQSLHFLSVKAANEITEKSHYLANAAAFASSRETLFNFLENTQSFTSSINEELEVVNPLKEAETVNKDFGQAFGVDLNQMIVKEQPLEIEDADNLEQENEINAISDASNKIETSSENNLAFADSDIEVSNQEQLTETIKEENETLQRVENVGIENENILIEEKDQALVDIDNQNNSLETSIENVIVEENEIEIQEIHHNINNEELNVLITEKIEKKTANEKIDELNEDEKNQPSVEIEQQENIEDQTLEEISAVANEKDTIEEIKIEDEDNEASAEIEQQENIESEPVEQPSAVANQYEIDLVEEVSNETEENQKAINEENNQVLAEVEQSVDIEDQTQKEIAEIENEIVLVKDKTDSIETDQIKTKPNRKSLEEILFDSPVQSDFFAFTKEKPKAKEIIQQNIKEEENATTVSQYNDDSLPYTFLWWLNKTRKEHSLNNNQPYVASKPAQQKKENKAISADPLNHQIAENIFHLRSVEDVEKNKQNANFTVPYNFRQKEHKIIEKFIKEEPQIKPPAANKIDTENKAKKSSEDTNEVVSETLAKIYVEQMLYHKALDVYKKLSLKYPEKSTYFASQIKYLELKVN